LAIGLLGGVISRVLNLFFGAGFWGLYVSISMIATFTASLFAGYGVQYALDAGEYGLWKTGKDNRLVVMSMTNMPMKIAGFPGMLALYFLAAVGFDSAQVAAVTGTGLLPAFVTQDFVNSYMAILCGIPAVCSLAAALLIFFAYKIKDNDAAQYAADNQAWMAARMAAGDDAEALAAIPDTPEAFVAFK
jgi:Na+/melibiose symporter-like transporter